MSFWLSPHQNNICVQKGTARDLKLLELLQNKNKVPSTPITQCSTLAFHTARCLQPLTMFPDTRIAGSKLDPRVSSCSLFSPWLGGIQLSPGHREKLLKCPCFSSCRIIHRDKQTFLTEVVVTLHIFKQTTCEKQKGNVVKQLDKKKRNFFNLLKPISS